MRFSVAGTIFVVSRLIFCLLCLFCSAQEAVSEDKIYRYVDAQGVAHYTNVPTDGYEAFTFPPLSTPRQEGITFRTPKVRSTDRKTLRLRSRKDRSGTRTGHGTDKFDHHIRNAARSHRLDPLLIKAVIKTESNFNRYAVSPKGAQGLMQLMPATARHLKVRDPFDPQQNIYGGAKYLRELLGQFNGNLHLSLAAYNAGPARVMKKKKIPRIPETIAYVRKVIRQYRAYQKSSRRQTSNHRTDRVPLTTSIQVRQMETVN
jgi:hypothetical protein